MKKNFCKIFQTGSSKNIIINEKRMKIKYYDFNFFTNAFLSKQYHKIYVFTGCNLVCLIILTLLITGKFLTVLPL